MVRLYIRQKNNEARLSPGLISLLILVCVVRCPSWVPFPVPPRVKFDELGAGRGVAFVADEVRALFADLDAALSITLETHGFSPWLGKSI